jgi:ATP-dependent DNA helicase HFM1/MER3
MAREDKEGVAVILCDLEQRSKYLQLGTSLSTLESSLHQALAEHINSEIVLGSIKNVSTAHKWLRNTFLFRRIQVNPEYYGIIKQSEQQSWSMRFDELVEETLMSLEENQLLAKEASGVIEATAFGAIASRAYVNQTSMSLIIKLSEDATKKEIVCALPSS